MHFGEILRNVRWGIAQGAKYSMFYSAWFAIAYVVVGVLLLAKGGMTVPLVFAFYLVAPICAGAVVGLLRPLGRSLAGQMLIGFVAALPLTAIGALLVFPVDEWTKVGWKFCLALAGLMGPLYGLVNWVVDLGPLRKRD
jgi:hypothetical protein